MLQILLLLAYLAIALIAIAIAIYAIAVSYFGRETFKSIQRMKKRREQLKSKITELSQRAGVEEIRKEIDKYEEEETQLKSKLDCLSVKKAVFYPCILFFIALIIAACGIYLPDLDPRVSEKLMIVTLIFVGVGFYSLTKTLGAIEWASLRVALPQFEVTFETYPLTTMKTKARKEQNITFIVYNAGEELAEDLVVFLYFPPTFKLIGQPYYNLVRQSEYTLHPDYTAAIFSIDKIHPDIFDTYSIRLKAKKKGSYRIPVRIHERKTGISDYQLTLEIE